MNTKKIILAVIAVIVCLTAIIIGPYFSYNNTEVRLRNEATAQLEKIEGTHDKMWKIIQQKAAVSEQYKEGFDSIYSHIMSDRYSSNDGSLMKWITESNPQFDSSLYRDLSESIEVYRTEFQASQERMLDIIRQHKTLCESYPSKWYVTNKTEIEYTMVSSTKSKNVMATGMDDDVDLFKE
jgi:hypothetical protein